MTGTDLLFSKSPTPTTTKPFATSATARTPVAVIPERPTAKAKPVILDMGEASREQGFRLNGCR